MLINLFCPLTNLPPEQRQKLMKELGVLQERSGQTGTEAEQRAFCALHRGFSLTLKVKLTKDGELIPLRVATVRRR